MQLPCKEDMTPKSQMHGGKIPVAGSNGIIGCPEEFTIKLLAHNGYEYFYAPNIAHGIRPKLMNSEIKICDK